MPSGVESNVRFFPPYPFLHVKRAKGPYIYDLDGNGSSTTPWATAQ